MGGVSSGPPRTYNGTTDEARSWRPEKFVTGDESPREIVVEGKLIRLDYTTPNFGGARVWALCPVCNRRCSYLYDWGALRLTCRICAGLTFSSRRLHRLKAYEVLRHCLCVMEGLGVRRYQALRIEDHAETERASTSLQILRRWLGNFLFVIRGGLDFRHQGMCVLLNRYHGHLVAVILGRKPPFPSARDSS